MNKHCLNTFLCQLNVIVLLLVGVCPIFATDNIESIILAEKEEVGDTISTEEECANKWLDTYPKHIGFTWGTSVTVVSNYIWRGLYVGGLSVQADATIGYGGLFANMWWNIGSTDWTFRDLNPEVDIAIGFSRWGLQIYYLHMYYFDTYADGSRSRFFDMRNYAPGGGGTTGEWRVAYRVSNRLPLSVLVACRTFGRDGYIKGGELKRAYSTYIEIGYDFALPHDWLLETRIGITPAKSMYTNYEGDFAVNQIGLKLQKQWLMNGYAIQAFGNVMLNTWQVNANNLIRPLVEANSQKLNVAIGCSIGL